MKRSAWLGIGVGTLVAAVGFWAGLLALQSNRTTGLAIIAGGVVFSVYAGAAFSGVEDAASVSFRAAMYAMTALVALMVMFQAGGGPSYAVAAPVFAVGVGGVFAIPPVRDSYRTAARIAAVGAVTLVAVGAYWVDNTVYALIAPLLPLPAVGIADKLLNKGREVLGEES